MLSSKDLKTFVTMHEYKLKAKINALQADRLKTEIGHKSEAAVEDKDRLAVAEDWYIHTHNFQEGRRRPQSPYFNFIVTASRQ